MPGSRSSSPTLGPAKTIDEIFPPVTKAHILNCSYPRWHSNYRSLTPKTRIIPLTPEFISYIREDGIILPSDEEQITELSDSEDENSVNGNDSDSESAPLSPPDKRFPELHQQIKDIISELGGRIIPKLNWSSPKDAVFMSLTNTMECRTPGEIYLLLKSSDFVTHDLEHAFDDCIDTPLLVGEEEVEMRDIAYSLVLRKWFKINPSMEFRCFVRGRKLLAVSQRELNYFKFLEDMKEELTGLIEEFFDTKLKDTFPDDSFVFDVYIPATEEGKKRVWLIDINPFAHRTDPILFSWLEILEMPYESDDTEVKVRFVKEGDPEAYAFNTPKFSASKMPKEVVEAGLQGEEAVWEFAQRWRGVMESMEKAREERQASNS
ncbi:D123-domain-containing protein [Ascodesmis nigricans]|uniref:D123-domain-containing protein n=1 Tax=Ascodesmis nigricans TaxID=341454 RepID=A0A4S2N7D0_9PEZI|nr:D123-domain-containing protein [Ascodesmis nigricans]